jgi:hypothetical protein
MADPVHGLNLSGDDNSKKSRKGSIPRNVETYLKTAAMNAFADEVAKLADEDPAAPPTKSKARVLKDMAQMGLLTGTAAPIIAAGRHFVEGAVDTPGGFRTRFDAGKARIKGTTKGDILGRALAAGVGGTLLGYAKNRLQQHQDQQKAAAAGGPPSGPRIAVAAGPSSSAKGMRIGNTPIAAKSGVTRTGASKPVNPRMSLPDAMAPKV